MLDPLAAYHDTSSAISLNDRAAAIVERMIVEQVSLGIAVHRLENEAVVVDCGSRTLGSFEAGRLYAEACMGGLGDVHLCTLDLGGWSTPGVEVDVEHPLLACMGSQLAGWAVEVPRRGDEPGFYALGSGPARALCRRERIFGTIEHRESSSTAVLSMESWGLPTERAADWIAEGCCRLSAEGLYLLIAPTASLAGSVQVAARVVEVALYKLHRSGFDLTTVFAAYGVCPVAPVAADDLAAVGRTNDGILYGGRVWLSVRCEDAAIEAILEELPSSASGDYGVPFGDLYERACADFYQIDPLLFSPAELYITNAKSGRTHHAGRVAPEIVRESFLG
ncbi:MAG: methenyltetrahydromethanopterin cyclohydrolase [Actinobacteria bacterium]|nr:methenyltetrahydromethanopterin cyclohydrolase [Actinomycetota bacterium]